MLSVAGYGVGTFEPSDEYWGAPQPESSSIFQQFLARQISRLATVPAVVIIHAPTDQVSSFCDTKHIVNTIKAHGGSVELVLVPECKANSDPKSNSKTKMGHSYFNYALLDNSSDEVLYSRLRDILSLAPRRHSYSEIVFHC